VKAIVLRFQKLQFHPSREGHAHLRKRNHPSSRHGEDIDKARIERRQQKGISRHKRYAPDCVLQWPHREDEDHFLPSMCREDEIRQKKMLIILKQISCQIQDYGDKKGFEYSEEKILPSIPQGWNYQILTPYREGWEGAKWSRKMKKRRRSNALSLILFSTWNPV
jgi:hypothetical protein